MKTSVALQVVSERERRRRAAAQETLESPASRMARICRARSCGRRGQFAFFLRHYFPHYFGLEFGEQQKEVIRRIQSARDRSERPPYKLLLAMSRGFGKSTLLSLCAVLWYILCGTWHFVILSSSNLTQAKDFLRKIIEECEDNELLAADWPELTPARDRKNQFVSWKDHDIVFGGGGRIIAKGILNAIRGARHKQHRPSAIIIDDPDEEKDVGSETLMRRKYRWLERAALKLGTAWGIDVLLSYTTIAPNCVGEYVYHDNQKFHDWDKIKFRALEVDSEGNEYSTWPAGAPLEVLQRERDEDPVTFAQERQNTPLAEMDQRFKGLVETYVFRPPVSWEGWRLSLGVDPSLGRNERAHYSAIVGVGLSPDGKLYQLYESIERRRPDKIIADTIAALSLFPFDLCGVDGSGNQDHFIDRLRDKIAEANKEMEHKIVLPVHSLADKGDKERRIESALQPLVAGKVLLIRHDSQILFKQLDEFPYNFHDGPDALEYAVRLLISGKFTPGGVFANDSPSASGPSTTTGRQLANKRLRRYGIQR